jgi:branched-chain amino acid transport system substrate-binding protein/urea transport system substrate-binding protein
MVFRDDGTRPQIAAEAARKVVEEDGALAVVGPITSQNLDAIVPVLASHRTPLLYATNYEGGQCSRYMFALNTVPNQELDSLLPYMTKTFGNDYFLLGADRDWPHRMFEAAEPLIARLGGKVVGKQYTLGTVKDFPVLADQLANSKAKVLL